MKTLAIIPARGGSKGIPNKNIKLFDGKPLIQYAIDAALEIFDRENICISTDSQKIKSVAELSGVDVPFIRPPELAGDTAGMYEVLLHALNFYKTKGLYPYILRIINFLFTLVSSKLSRQKFAGKTNKVIRMSSLSSRGARMRSVSPSRLFPRPPHGHVFPARQEIQGS